MKFIYEILVQSDNLSELRTRIENFEIGENIAKYGLNAVFDNTFSSLPATKDSEISFIVPKQDTVGFEISSDKKIISEIIRFLPDDAECIIRKTDTGSFAQKIYSNADVFLYPYAIIKLHLFTKDIPAMDGKKAQKTVIEKLFSLLLLAEDSDIAILERNFPNHMYYHCRVGKDSAEQIRKEYKLLSLTDLEDLTREDPTTLISVEIKSVKKI